MLAIYGFDILTNKIKCMLQNLNNLENAFLTGWVFVIFIFLLLELKNSMELGEIYWVVVVYL